LLAWIVIVGGAVTVLAILQFITRTDKIFWVVPQPWPIAEAGPFVNHSNFSQFISLSVGAAIALIFVRFQELGSGRRISTLKIIDYMTSSSGRWVWFCIGMIVLSIS